MLIGAIRDLQAAGAKTPMDIAARLNERGIPATRGPWNAVKVEKGIEQVQTARREPDGH